MAIKYEYRMSDQVRRSKNEKEIFLKWVKKFNGRKPTTKETVEEMKGGCLASLVEQDVNKAYNKYVYEQAQYWLRHVEVIRINTTMKTSTKPVRAFIPTKISQHGRIREEDYVSAKAARKHVEVKQTILEKAIADFESYLHRYQRYAEFMEEFEPLIDEFERIKTRIERDLDASKKESKTKNKKASKTEHAYA